MTTNRLPAEVNTTTKEAKWEFSNPEFDNLTLNYLPIQCFFSGGLNKYALIGSEENRLRFLSMSLQLCKEGPTLILLEKAFNMTQLDFNTRDQLFELIETDSDRNPKYCFALQIDEFDTATDQYSIQVIFLRKNIPDTTKPSYN